MKRLRSVISVEDKPAVKRQRVRCKRSPRKHAATAPSSSSFTHRNNGMSNVSHRPRRRQSAVKSLPDATRGQDTEVSTRLFISNISDEVPSLRRIIELLFEQIGRLRRHKIHFDPEGHFQGTAEVVYDRRGDAIAAVRCYDNNINFFGRTWKVELVGENQVSLIEGSRPLAAESGACKQTIQSRLHECGSSRVDRRKRARLRDSRKRNQDADLEEYYSERQPARERKRLTMREALDADLDRYHKDRMADVPAQKS